jgi:hypothetical protein
MSKFFQSFRNCHPGKIIRHWWFEDIDASTRSIIALLLIIWVFFDHGSPHRPSQSDKLQGMISLNLSERANVPLNRIIEDWSVNGIHGANSTVTTQLGGTELFWITGAFTKSKEVSIRDGGTPRQSVVIVVARNESGTELLYPAALHLSRILHAPLDADYRLVRRSSPSSPVVEMLIEPLAKENRDPLAPP